MKISIIAAIGKNRELGKDNKLLWHIPEDFKRFKALTSGHAIIMGRKTWESLPIKPLPNRFNIVISRKAGRLEKGATVFFSLEKALKEGRLYEEKMFKENKREIFIIGGRQIYKQVLPIADKLYLTIIDASFDADTFFPPYAQFKKEIEKGRGKWKGYKYKFLELEK